MKVISIYSRGFGANTYAVTTDGQHAVVIDPAQPRVYEELEKRGLQAKYVLLTHCHFDHIGGVSVLQNAGAKVLCTSEEKRLVDTHADLCAYFNAPPADYEIDETLNDGQTLDLCGMQIRVLLTAGHTKGSACYLFTSETGDTCLFTGDTLFRYEVGRTDLPGGDYPTLLQSLRRLAELDGEYCVLPGHEEISSLDAERKFNRYIQEAMR